jgi:hypothetical protein
MTGDDPELADVVALLLCHMRRDQAAAVALLESMGRKTGLAAAGHAVTMALEIACRYAPGGQREVEELLTSWQEQRRESL